MWAMACLEELKPRGGQSWCNMCGLCKASGLAWGMLLVLP